MHDLLQLMYQDGHLSSTELTALKRTSRQLRENPVRILRSLNIVTPSEIKDLLQHYYGFSAATDQLIEELDDTLRALIPADIALHYCVLPIAEDKGQLYILMEDPTDKGAIAQLEFFLGRKIIPVIATVQQLSNGLCQLYGVEPRNLRLSGLLETSRGAVGIAPLQNQGQEHLADDAQPLLDDEIFKTLRPRPVKPVENSHSTPQSRSATTVEVEPALAAALNLLGLRLTLARNRNEAVDMAHEKLKEFDVFLKLEQPDTLVLSWADNKIVVALKNGAESTDLPVAFRALVKKIAHYPYE